MSAARNAPHGIPPDVAEAAMTWWVELHADPVADDLRAACQQWRATRPEHERAWQIIAAAHGRLRASGLPGALARAALAAPRSPARRKAVKTLAVLLFAGGAAWTAHRPDAAPRWLADLRTGTGERRDVVLADGTQLTLDTGSAVDVRFDDAERRLRLLAGRIHIVTAADGAADRPFIVDTAQGSARALGTRFTVRQDDGSSHVAVHEGRVALTPRRGGAPLVLAAGEQARFDARAADRPQPVRDSDDAWRRGMLIATGMRLDDFVAELGRYRAGWLLCDPEAAALRVSGSFPLADTDRALDALANALPVDIVRRSRYWATVRPRGEPG